MFTAPGLGLLEVRLGGFGRCEVLRSAVLVIAAGFALCLETARRAVGGDDGAEGGGGGDEERLHGQGQVADYVETRVGCVDYCSALQIELACRRVKKGQREFLNG